MIFRSRRWWSTCVATTPSKPWKSSCLSFSKLTLSTQWFCTVTTPLSIALLQATKLPPPKLVSIHFSLRYVRLHSSSNLLKTLFAGTTSSSNTVVAGQEMLPDTDENKLAREKEERLASIHLYRWAHIQKELKVVFDLCDCFFIPAGPGLTTDWNPVTATAPEAPTRMKRVRFHISKRKILWICRMSEVFAFNLNKPVWLVGNEYSIVTLSHFKHNKVSLLGITFLGWKAAGETFQSLFSDKQDCASYLKGSFTAQVINLMTGSRNCKRNLSLLLREFPSALVRPRSSAQHDSC